MWFLYVFACVNAGHLKFKEGIIATVDVAFKNCLLGCNAGLSGRSLLMFQRILIIVDGKERQM
jgi:hypothetical protein